MCGTMRAMHPLIASHLSSTLTTIARGPPRPSVVLQPPGPFPSRRSSVRSFAPPALLATCDRTPIQTQLICSAPSTRPSACSPRPRARPRPTPRCWPRSAPSWAVPARCGCPATTASCIAPRRGRWTRRQRASSLPGVWERGRPDAHSGPPAAFAFPLPGVGVMGFSTAAPLVPDASLLATMDSLGSQISQFVERCRAQADLRESDARKSAILNAAFDCIITMDHHGNVVEVNRADGADVRLPRGGDDRARAGRADRAAVAGARRTGRGSSGSCGRAAGRSAATRSRRRACARTAASSRSS